MTPMGMKLSARIVSTVKEIICPDSGCYDTEGSEIDCPKCYDDQGSETNCPKYYDNQGNEIVCPNCYDSEDLMFPENGYSDWRLPDSNEVLTIFDHSKNSLNEVFSGSPSSCWSSTTRIYDEGHAWRAYSGGAVTYTTKSANDYAFAVRDAKVYDYGDIDHSDGVDLADAVLALKVSAGLPLGDVVIHIDADVNGDGKIGVEEVIYALQYVAK